MVTDWLAVPDRDRSVRSVGVGGFPCFAICGGSGSFLSKYHAAYIPAVAVVPMATM